MSAKRPPKAKPMAAEKAKVLIGEMNLKADWMGTCRVCGAALSGTPKQLKEHADGHSTATT